MRPASVYRFIAAAASAAVCAACVAQTDPFRPITLLRDASTGGRVLVLDLHPSFMGQAFRSGFLEDVLAHMKKAEGLWAASGVAIVGA